MDDLVRLAGTSFANVRLKGALLSMSIEWDCNFDKAASLCNPNVTLNRLDDPASTVSSGFNFRSGWCAASSASYMIPP